MSDFLSEMSAHSVSRARETRERSTLEGLLARARSAEPARALDLEDGGFDLIAEAKLASPSEGRLAEGGNSTVTRLSRLYEAAGAAAISVLTEPTRFEGDLAHLEAAAAAVDVPVMCKDFLVDPIQVIEARAFGASGVLLLARLLPGELLVEMAEQALDLGMFVLVEVFDRSDIETAVPVFERGVLVGVNCRDLATLEVDNGRFRALAPFLPEGPATVAESGIDGIADVTEVARLGYRMALVGTSLVSSSDPAYELAAMIAAGREASSEAAG